MTAKLSIIVLLFSMVIIIGAPKPSRRFVDDEVDDVKQQADDTIENDGEGMIYFRCSNVLSRGESIINFFIKTFIKLCKFILSF